MSGHVFRIGEKTLAISIPQVLVKALDIEQGDTVLVSVDEENNDMDEQKVLIIKIGWQDKRKAVSTKHYDNSLRY